MKDVFYTILIVWIVWRVLNSIGASGTKQESSVNKPIPKNKRSVGETSVDYAPPTKKNINDDEGEYVDYEEIK